MEGHSPQAAGGIPRALPSRAASSPAPPSGGACKGLRRTPAARALGRLRGAGLRGAGLRGVASGGVAARGLRGGVVTRGGAQRDAQRRGRAAGRAGETGSWPGGGGAGPGPGSRGAAGSAGPGGAGRALRGRPTELPGEARRPRSPRKPPRGARAGGGKPLEGETRRPSPQEPQGGRQLPARVGGLHPRRCPRAGPRAAALAKGSVPHTAASLRTLPAPRKGGVAIPKGDGPAEEGVLPGGGPAGFPRSRAPGWLGSE